MENKAIRLGMAAAALAAFGFAAGPALAAHGGGMGGGMGGGSGAHMGGGMSSGHISGQGSLNTNGPNSTDRDFGRDRAEDRANAHASFSTNTTHASLRAGGSTTAGVHRWRHGRHHHYGWSPFPR